MTSFAMFKEILSKLRLKTTVFVKLINHEVDSKRECFAVIRKSSLS